MVVVRNTADHDGRVMRAARTMQSLGVEAVVLAVTSTTVQGRTARIEGVPIVRISPGSPFQRVRKFVRRFRPSTAASGNRHSEELGTKRRGERLLIIHRLFVTLSYYRRAIALIRAWQPAILHCNDYNTMWVGVAARFLVGSCVIYDSHELWPDRNQRSETRWWLLLCEALFVRVASETITTSPGFADVIERRYRVVRPPVVRNIPESRASTQRGPSKQDIVAVYVGAITTNRGLEQTIEALSAVPRVHLRVIGLGGDGYRAELERLASNAGVTDRVVFDPPVLPGQVVQAISDADFGLALIQPICLSYLLSLPNKVFEYLAADLPILGSDLPVIGSFIREHRVGLLARPDDIPSITTKLEQMADDSRAGRFADAVESTARQLTWAAESQTLRSIYQRCLSAETSSLSS